MGMATGDTSLRDWSLLSTGEEEKLGDWCVPSCSGEAEEHEEMSSSKTSEGEGRDTEAEKKSGLLVIGLELWVCSLML